MICAKSGKNWSGSSGEDFYMTATYFPIFPFEEDLALYLNKLEFPSSKDNLYQV
jgi:hypothetical protein